MFVLFLSWFALVDAWWQDSKVLTLTSASFDEIVGEEKYVAVEYFTPWCHYCRMMFGEWEHVWKHYSTPEGLGNSQNVVVARMNGDDHRETVHKQGVHSYPTILLYKPGQKQAFSHYHGIRTAAKFIEWIDASSYVQVLPKERIEESPVQPVEVLDKNIEEAIEEDVDVDFEPHNEHDEEDITVQYEVVMTDISKDLNDKWRGDLQDLRITQEDMRKEVLGELSELRFLISEIRSGFKEEAAKESIRFYALEERLERLEYDVMSRNRSEASQLHLNPSHMMVFLSVGFVLGCCVALVASKTRQEGKGYRSKV